jgi:short-subunit dehydrogenase
MIELAEKDMQFIMDVNVLGTYNVNKAFFPLLDRQASGEIAPLIINTGSEVSYASLSAPFATPYAMSKIAIESYSIGLRQELATLQNPVNVTVLNPGAIGTQMLEMQRNPQQNPMLRHAMRAEGTLFEKQLKNGAKVSEAYVIRNKVPPNVPAEAVYEVVHATNPPRNRKVNVSLEMEAVRRIPQFVLDVANRMMM